MTHKHTPAKKEANSTSAENKTAPADVIIESVLRDMYAKPMFTPTEKSIVWQLEMAKEISNSNFDGFEMNPCAQIGLDEKGRMMFEKCEENDPNIKAWSVYGHIPNAGLDCLIDLDDKETAVKVHKLLTMALVAA